MNFDHHWRNRKNSKYILSLDGGGIRGVISIAFLERIEELLKEHYEKKDGKGTFKLTDHFSLAGGTSTGALIATCIALGKSAKETKDLYFELADKAFTRKYKLLPKNMDAPIGLLFGQKFDATALAEAIKDNVGDTTLGSDDLQCGLGIVAKRLDTNSVWIFHNHPDGPFYHGKEGEKYTPNKDLKLKHILRATTAAPTYFEPETIKIGDNEEGLFVDGGVSPHNNPALALFKLATLKGYGFQWPTNHNEMHITSLGTGLESAEIFDDILNPTIPLSRHLRTLMLLLLDCNVEVQTMMQYMGKCPNPVKIDSEIEDLKTDQLGLASMMNPNPDPLFKYCRYNIEYNQKWFNDHLGLEYDNKKILSLSKIDKIENIEELYAIGQETAKRQIKLEDLLL